MNPSANPSVRSKNTTVTSLENAIAANLVLQEEITRRIQRISDLKLRNRRDASKTMARLCHLWDKKDIAKAPKIVDRPIKYYSNFFDRSEQKKIRELGDDADEYVNPQKRPKAIKNRWMSDHTRPWNHQFWTDPDGSQPEPNTETTEWISSSSLITANGNDDDESDSDPDFITSPTLRDRLTKWTPAEKKALVQIVSKIQNKTNKKRRGRGNRQKQVRFANTTTFNEDIDFTLVARQLKEQSLTTARKKNIRWKPLLVRTPTECRLKYLNDVSPSINHSPFSKSESLRILELIHQHQEKQQQQQQQQQRSRHHSSRSLTTTPWDMMARDLGANHRTPWQCFHHYQTSLNTKLTRREWLPEEDELLLKSVAAMGPTFVLNKAVACEFGRRFFPERSVKQILVRASSSLVNPNFVKENWSDEEERRLVLCMKIYRDELSPLNAASLHFPDRASVSVSHKWHSSLDPFYDTQTPFTPEEDKQLLAAVQRAGGPGKWTEVMRFFPKRKRTTLQNRWYKISGDKDLVKRYEDVLKGKEGGGKRGVVGRSGVNHLSPDDFVVRVKKKG